MTKALPWLAAVACGIAAGHIWGAMRVYREWVDEDLTLIHDLLREHQFDGEGSTDSSGTDRLT